MRRNFEGRLKRLEEQLPPPEPPRPPVFPDAPGWIPPAFSGEDIGTAAERFIREYPDSWRTPCLRQLIAYARQRQAGELGLHREGT